MTNAAPFLPCFLPLPTGSRAATPRLREQLRALGTAGVVSYGLLNTAYYTCAFLFVWIYVAKVPPGEPREGGRQTGSLFSRVTCVT